MTLKISFSKFTALGEIRLRHSMFPQRALCFCFEGCAWEILE